VRMGPGYFPTVLGGILAVLGAVVLLTSFTMSGPKVPKDQGKIGLHRCDLSADSWNPSNSRQALPTDTLITRNSPS